MVEIDSSVRRLESFRLDSAASHPDLKAHARRLSEVGLQGLQEEPDRSGRWVLDAPGGWRMDFTKQCVDDALWGDLLSLADAADWRGALDVQFGGRPVNATEGRAVLHMALRGEKEDGFEVGGDAVMERVLRTREAMLAFVDDVRSGAYSTVGGQRFTHVVNIGIGGSDLGPVMVHEALAPLRMGEDRPLEVRFVSNVDPFHLDEVLDGLDPHSTLIVVVSKTFTTQETMANADRARKWLSSAIDGKEVGRHLAAVSSNVQGASAMGIDPSRVFGFDDWVGGRFSLWGPVGLAIALGSGSEAFRQLLSGAREVDLHVRSAAADRNVPLHLALIDLWNVNYLGRTSRVVLPYAQALRSWPAYLQQAEMESNGKAVGRDGAPVAWSTSPVVWGAAGTNGQHAFHQLLHQGTEVHPMDFVAFRQPMGGDPVMHRMLLANAVAQAEAFCRGRGADEVRQEMAEAGATEDRIAQVLPHRVFPGGRPSTFMLADRLDAKSLGALIALHEHRIFLTGLFWGVFSFDQWGVELGKMLAHSMLDPEADLSGWTPGSLALRESMGFQ